MITLMNKRAKNKKGFTLIELLVVLAILAIIALIAVPNFIGIREESAQKADTATIETIEKALELMIINENVTPSSEVVATVPAAGGSIALSGSLSSKTATNYITAADIEIQSTDYPNGITFRSDANGKVTGTATVVTP